MNVRLLAILILSILGGIIKVVGGVFYGSKALVVDAFTSIANIVSAILVIYYYNKAMRPPDKDHMYGHYRLTIAGPIYTVVIYSAVFGIVATELLFSFGREYVVSKYAPVMAFIGFVVYLGAILLSKDVDVSFRIYAKFTGGELIESIVTILASLSGALLSYIIDFMGAILLSTFILYEVYVSTRNIMSIVSDETSKEIIRDIKMELDDLGVGIQRIRVRRVVEDVFHGDVTVSLPPQMSVEEAHLIADEIEKALKKKYNIDVTVHIEPSFDSTA